MEIHSPFAQHLDTNYIPTSQELDTLNALVGEREVAIDAIDAEIAELQRKREANIQFVRKHQALATPVRRLPDDILLTIVVECIASAKPWPSPHPSVVASQVCRRWRDLALTTPLLWTKMKVLLSLGGIWDDLYGHNPPPLQRDRRPFFRPFTKLCRIYLCTLARTVRIFMERSSGCPLQLRAVVHDNVEVPPPTSPFDPWSEMFEPVAQVISDSTTRWENITLELLVSPESSLAFHFLRIPIASSGLGMGSATLCIQTSHPISEARWNAVLPGGKLDLHSAQLRSFSIRMAYADMLRVKTSWDGLTTLTFGSPLPFSPFLPLEALRILRSTPNLTHCTIHLCIPPIDQTPPLDSLTLSHLESLTIMGDLPPRAFAEALHLPSLTRLLTGEAMSPQEGGNTSSVFLWVKRHGTQLKEVSVAHPSLAKPALSVALKNLPNVESLELVWELKGVPAGLQSAGSDFTFDGVGVLGELDPDHVNGCSCPNVRALTLRLWDGGDAETREVIINLIGKRRSANRPSSIARLDKVDLSFCIPSSRSILLDLKNRGVDTEGVSIRTEPRS